MTSSGGRQRPAPGRPRREGPARAGKAYQRLWDTLHAMLTGEQRRLLDSLAVVPEGERFSPLERWRRGPAKASGLNMVKALDRCDQMS